MIFPIKNIIIGITVTVLIGAVQAASFGYTPDGSVDEMLREHELRSHYPLVRLAASGNGMMNLYNKSLYRDSKRWSLMADVTFYSIRNANGNGFDFYARLTGKSFQSNSVMADKNLYVKDFLLMSSGFPGDAAIVKSAVFGYYFKTSMMMLAADIGVKYTYGFGFRGFLIQFYILAAPRFLFAQVKSLEFFTGRQIDQKKFYSLGFIGGAGFEIPIISFLAVFTEYNIGYTPVGRSNANVEGHQVFCGITARL